MNRLIIVGAGGCGREVLQWAKDVNDKEKTWEIAGFLDDNENALEGVPCDVSVLGGVDTYKILPEDVFVCAIGNPKIKKLVTEKLKARGAKFTTLVHPTAVVADNALLDEGVILYPFSLVSDNAHVGAHSIVNMYSSVAHDSVLGEYCIISAHCDVTGACTLGDGVFMGTTSNMVPRTKIGNYAFICAGSTVMTRVKDGVKVMGNPARKMDF